MTNKNYTHFILLIDSSGSMGSMQADAEGSINSIIKAQAAADLGKITISLYDFASNYKRVFGPIDAKEAPLYELRPSGGTALIYSACKVIDEQGAWLRNLPSAQRPDKVIMVIVTDGGENGSTAFNPRPYNQGWLGNVGAIGGIYNDYPPVGEFWTSESFRRRTEEQMSKYGWEFVFPAANVNAVETARAYGIHTTVQYQNSGASYAGAMSSVNDGLLATRSGTHTMASFIGNTNVDTAGNVTREENPGTNTSNSSTESTTSP
jgi:hypothetical protein